MSLSHNDYGAYFNHLKACRRDPCKRSPLAGGDYLVPSDRFNLSAPLDRFLFQGPVFFGALVWAPREFPSRPTASISSDPPWLHSSCRWSPPLPVVFPFLSLLSPLLQSVGEPKRSVGPPPASIISYWDDGWRPGVPLGLFLPRHIGVRFWHNCGVPPPRLPLLTTSLPSKTVPPVRQLETVPATPLQGRQAPAACRQPAPNCRQATLKYRASAITSL